MTTQKQGQAPKVGPRSSSDASRKRCGSETSKISLPSILEATDVVLFSPSPSPSTSDEVDSFVAPLVLAVVEVTLVPALRKLPVWVPERVLDRLVVVDRLVEVPLPLPDDVVVARVVDVPEAVAAVVVVPVAVPV